MERRVEAFRDRKGLVDRMPWFRGFALPVDWERLEALVATRWESREAFEAWVESEEFRRAHSGARGPSPGVSSEGGLYEVVLGEC